MTAMSRDLAVATAAMSVVMTVGAAAAGRAGLAVGRAVGEDMVAYQGCRGSYNCSANPRPGSGSRAASRGRRSRPEARQRTVTADITVDVIASDIAPSWVIAEATHPGIADPTGVLGARAARCLGSGRAGPGSA